MVRSSASFFLFFRNAGTDSCLFFRCTRSGSLNEHRQPNIPKSEYLQRLDDGEEDELNPLSDSELVVKNAQKGTGQSKAGQVQMQEKHFSPQYWSDYNRMYFIPRSVHALSDSWIDTTDSDGVNKVYGFGRGREVYRRYEQVRWCVVSTV